MEGKGRRVAFDRYTADLRARELFRDGRPVPIQDKPFLLLTALLENAGDVVTRDELCDALWPRDTHVEREAGLNTAVRKLRTALGSSADHDLLETVPRVGYRLRVDPRYEDSASFGGRATLADPATATRRVPAWRLALGAAVALVSTVVVLTTATRAPRPADPMPDEPEIRALYVEARGLLATSQDLERAGELFETVAASAPRFAPGHAHLAEVRAWIAVRTGAAAAAEEARAATARALELDPDSAVAHRARAVIALHFDRDLDAATAALDRALESAPDDPVNYLARATFESVLGRHRTALAAVRKAVDLAPETMSIRSDAGYFLLRAGRPDEAIAECEMVLRLDAHNSFGLDCLVLAHGLAGSSDALRAVALRALESAGASATERQRLEAAADPLRSYLVWKLDRLLAETDPPPVQVAGTYVALGEDDRALEWLARAARSRAPALVYVPGDTRFARLGADQRYAAILRQARLETLASS